MFRKRAGIVLLHGGIGLIMVYDVLVGTKHIESRMLIEEGQTVSYSEDIRTVELAVIDRAFPDVRLSAFSATVTRDTRDDPLDPTRGLFMSAEGSVAARSLGGEVGFLKSYLQVQGYRMLTAGRARSPEHRRSRSRPGPHRRPASAIPRTP